MIVNAKPSGVLSLGRTGENQARSIRFDISHWVMDFGPGVVELVHQRSGDPYPYPVVVSQDGNEVTWNITSTDTAMVGLGRCELRYYVGETLAKSETWMTKVFPALGPAAETPPDPYQSLVDQVLQAGAAVAEAADRVEEAAVRQPYPNAETGTWWVWDAESGAYTDTGVSYGTGGGTSDHDKLLGRDKENQHPMSAITGLVDALAGKQPTGSYLTKETDPKVPAWAKAETKPSYTAAEVGADPAGTATARVSEHNTETTAHGDIRLLIQGLTDRLNAMADSDDTTLDQLSEIVAYIKANRDLIAAVTTDKVSVGDIVNDLVTNVANKPLSAAQGVALKALIDSLNASDIGAIPVPVTATVGQTIRVSAVDETGRPTEWEAVDMTSGDESELPLIQEYTIEEEDVNTIEFTDLQNLTEFELFVSWNWQTVTGTSNVKFSLYDKSGHALNLSNALNRGINGGIWIQGRPVSKSKPEWIRFLGSFVCYNNSNSGASTVQVSPTSSGIVKMNLYAVTTTVYFPVGTVVTLRGK